MEKVNNSSMKSNTVGAVSEAALERDFCEAWLDRRMIRTDHFYSKIFLPTNTCAALLMYFVAHPTLRDTLTSAHALLILINIVIWSRSLREKSSQLLNLAAWFLTNVAYIYCLSNAVGKLGEDDVLPLAAMVLALAALQSFFLRTKGTLYFLPTAVTIVLGIGAMAEHPAFMKWAICYFSFCAATVGMSLATRRNDMQQARREFKLRTNVLPTSMIVKSAESIESLDNIFKPAKRHCVCISSDWRNYQAMTATHSAEDLAQALSKYYELCKKEISDILPQGNFYLDWIADELFLVIFAKDGADEAIIVNQALQFAIKLVKMKQAFMHEHGLPGAIDIGISAGSAHVGLMGPRGNMKATALGEIPGRARRLQACGKILRAKHGDTDRIIFGVESLMKISVAFQVHQHDIGGDVTLRDLKDKTLFFIEPEGAHKQQVA